MQQIRVVQLIVNQSDGKLIHSSKIQVQTIVCVKTPLNKIKLSFPVIKKKSNTNIARDDA